MFESVLFQSTSAFSNIKDNIFDICFACLPGRLAEVVCDKLSSGRLAEVVCNKLSSGRLTEVVWTFFLPPVAPVTIIHHYSPVFTIIHHYSPLFTSIHLFTIIHQYSPLFTIFRPPEDAPLPGGKGLEASSGRRKIAPCPHQNIET